MNTPVRLTAYAIGLVMVFGAAAGAGRVVGPSTDPAPVSHGHAPTESPVPALPGGLQAALPGGLQVVEDGYRLEPLTTRLGLDAAQPFRFRILGPDGAPVTAYTPNHEKDLHLIVVRRDLTGFQHVHPALDGDGTWSVPLAVTDPGQYRVFADFQPSGHEALTLGVDVPAPGDYQPVPLPAPARTAEVDGYTVTLTGDLVAGTSSPLTLTVSRDGQPVTDLQPYLGALGHLVVLRDGDLAYLHVHPSDGPAVTFSAEVPSAGVYRLYLDFQHGDKVHTAAFTATTSGVAPPADPTGHDADGHTHE
ncbi:hypothetical protein [Actinoplanes rectilineatus]|uniref:hypothetical protein n=1 Tax=Actinoplanes rectilineatus TaxID=113571 RepID=UPI0005F2A3E9|nr:hypothetical protein [Actinoplanes rectilineatus]